MRSSGSNPRGAGGPGYPPAGRGPSRGTSGGKRKPPKIQESGVSSDYSEPQARGNRRNAAGTAVNLPPMPSTSQYSEEESSIVVNQRNSASRKKSRAGSRAGGMSNGRTTSKGKASGSKKRQGLGGWDGFAMGLAADSF